jgi:glycosyltransferase involved in cell wall biosynthesis
MKVLFLSHSYPREPSDPVGSFVLRLAVALRDAGVDVSVVAPAAPGLAAREEFEGIPVRRFRYAPRSRETLAYTGTMLAQASGSLSARAALGAMVAANFIAAARAARRIDAEVVHAHWWFPGGLVGTGLRALRGTPLVTTLHGSDIRAARASGLAARLFRHVMKSSSAVTTVSRWLAEETRAAVTGVDPIVAPMPVAPGLFTPGGRRERDRLLFVGKLNAQKGIEPLIHALELMRSRPMLDIVVGVGSDPAPVQALADRLGVGGQLRFHPLLPQTGLAALYRECTALAAPMIGEGLGLVAIEASLCEMPVVAFASGGLTDIVRHERTGLLVPEGDVAALAGALDDLLSRADQGADLGRAARVHALETFAPDAVARRYAELYRRIAAPRGARA